MNTILRQAMSVALLWCTAMVLPGIPAGGQEAAADDDQKAARENTFRERTIYIPYEKLRKVFEARGRGVFLPYEEFQELWKAAREKRTPPSTDKPPVGALISEIENEGTVAGDVMQFKARLKIELLGKGWHKIPLRLSDAAITRATIAGKPARIISDAKRGYQLLVQRGAKETETSPIELALEFAKAITRAPGRNSVSLQVPQAPVSRWRITIPEPGVKVDIQPLLAASEVPETEAEADKSPKQTVVLAFVGAAPTVSIAWTPKTEGATGLAALATVKSQQQVWIQEGVTRTQCRLAYTIARAKLPSLAIEVPADQKVINVFDANVRQWSVAKVDDRQRIDVQLFEPAEAIQNLTVELERFNEPADGMTVTVPVLKASGVGRQQGVVVVQVAPGLRAETSVRSGLLQVDARELPGSLARGKWDFAYRYATVPFELKLAVEKVEPRVSVDSLTEIDLSPDRIVMSLSAVYTVERAGIFRLEWDVPEGYDVREVRGAKLSGAAAAQVDTHHLTGDKKTRLVVNLARKALGRTGLLVRLEKDLQLPELLAPTEKPAQIGVVVPRVVGRPIEEDRGRLLVRAPESLRVNPAKQEGLRAVSFAEALQGMKPVKRRSTSPLRPVLAFAFGRDPVALTLAAERRKPQVTVAQLLSMRIEDDTVKYEALFTYDVLYSGVKSLRIDVPESLAERLRNETPGIRDSVVDPAPDDLPEKDQKYQAWSFSGETEFLGRGKIKLVWEEKLDKLGVGQEVSREIPCLIPAKADDAPIDRAWGQIVLAKAETIELRPSGTVKGLRPIDPEHDLMGGVKVAQAAQAFEFHGPWSLGVTATRYELQDVKHTSIEDAVVRMVVTRAEVVAVQALYRLRSAQQRLEVDLPKDVAFDINPLRVNGQPITLEHTGDRFFIPLVGSNPEKPLLVDLRYTRPGDGSVLSPPEFPENPAIQRVHLCVYLPEETALLHVAGPWTNEIRWEREETMNLWRPTHPSSDVSLIESLHKDIAMKSNPTEGFETDGRRYVFSTLRPTGALKLTKADQTSLTAILFVLMVLGGVALLAAPMKIRILAVGGLVAVVVLCRVFAPLFAVQILDGYFVAALVIVVVVWIAVFFYRYQLRVRSKAAPCPSVGEHAHVSESMPPSTQPPGDTSGAPPPAPQPESPAEEQPDTPAEDPATDETDEGSKSDA